jgi:hypothetical protein
VPGDFLQPRYENYPKKSFQPRKHTEDTETHSIPGATISDGGAGVKLMILSGFFRVIRGKCGLLGSM